MESEKKDRFGFEVRMLNLREAANKGQPVTISPADLAQLLNAHVALNAVADEAWKEVEAAGGEKAIPKRLGGFMRNPRYLRQLILSAHPERAS